MNKHECNIEGCANEGVYQVKFLLRPWKNGPAAEGFLSLYCCEEHKDHPLYQRLLDEPGWSQIKRMFGAINRMTPLRKHSEIILVPISEGKELK